MIILPRIQCVKEFSRFSMCLLCIASLMTADEPLIDLAHEAAIDAQQQAERLEIMNAAWRKECEGAAARGFVFRVVDQSGNPAAGVAVALSTTRWNPGVTVDSASGTTTWLEAVTDADGLARLRSPLGHVFSASLVASKLDDDRWALANANEEPPVVQFEGSPEAVAAGIPADRRPAGVDYEFRVIRYPSPAPVVYWESRLMVPPDGSPQAWNPLALVLLPPKTNENRQPVVIPGDWPAEWEVRLWRDPEVPVRYLHHIERPDGRVRRVATQSKVHWTLHVTVLRGAIKLAPWVPRQRDSADIFPESDDLPEGGFVRELFWDIDETQGVCPIAWNRAIPLYWQRNGPTSPIMQCALMPQMSQVNPHGRDDIELLSTDDYQFGVFGIFRVRPDGERPIVLPTDAQPTVGGIRDASDRPQPTWYRWATREQLAGWLTEPVPEPGKP